MASDTEVLSDGHVETGQNCFDKTLNLGRNGLIGGAMYGTFEACFITEKSKSPLIFKAFRLIGARGLLGGAVLSTFAGVACLSSKFRKKDDYVNAFIAGGSAFSIFGIVARSVSLTIGLSFGGGALMALLKYRHGEYFPPLQPSTITTKEREDNWWVRP